MNIWLLLACMLLAGALGYCVGSFHGYIIGRRLTRQERLDDEREWAELWERKTGIRR